MGDGFRTNVAMVRTCSIFSAMRIARSLMKKMVIKKDDILSFPPRSLVVKSVFFLSF